MLFLEPIDAAIDLRETPGQLGVAATAFNVAQSARALDVRPAPSAIKFQLPQIVVDHRFDQFVPRQHALAGRSRGFRLSLRPSRIARAVAVVSHGIRTARPLMRPWCKSCKASFAALNLYSRVYSFTSPRSASAISSTNSA